MISNTIFLIKPYSQYIVPAPDETIHYIFKINDIQYAIVETTLEWGQPQLGLSIEQQDDCGYFLYNSLDEAMAYAKMLKEINK